MLQWVSMETAAPPTFNRPDEVKQVEIGGPQPAGVEHVRRRRRRPLLRELVDKTRFLIDSESPLPTLRSHLAARRARLCGRLLEEAQDRVEVGKNVLHQDRRVGKMNHVDLLLVQTGLPPAAHQLGRAGAGRWRTRRQNPRQLETTAPTLIGS